MFCLETLAASRHDWLDVFVREAKLIKTVLRYGSLLGVLLVLFEFLRNANRLTFLDERAYIGAIAFLFLCGGILLARSFPKPKIVEKPRNPATVKPNPDLSDRERDVLSYLVHGFTNAEIANSLGVTQNTVKTHLKNLFAKLEVSNRTEAAAEAKMRGLVE